MEREKAKDRFWTLWFSGFVIGLLVRWLDPPEGFRVPLIGLYLSGLVWFGAAWLRAALRDGSLGCALPEYGWAALSLAIITVACGLVALAVLAALGESITATSVSTGAGLGLFAVLVVWWLVPKSRQQRASGRRV